MRVIASIFNEKYGTHLDYHVLTTHVHVQALLGVHGSTYGVVHFRCTKVTNYMHYIYMTN